MTAEGALDPASAAALRPTLTAAQEEAAARNCPPRDPRLINPDDSSDSDQEEEDKKAVAIGAHRDRDWRPIVAKACMALERIDKTLAALDEAAGPDPVTVAASKEGLPQPVNVAADGETPLVFEKEHAVEYPDDDDADADPARAAAKGDLIEKLVRDANSEEASAEEKSALLGRMLDAASVQEAETAKALGRGGCVTSRMQLPHIA